MFLGLDLGTSSLKALAIDERGRVVASATRSYPLYRPHPGWAIQQPEDWWAALIATLGELRARGVALAACAAIGVTGQMHGLVLLDAYGSSLGPCQTWADARCDTEARRIERHIGRQHLVTLAGSRASASATAAKLLWVKRHEPERWQVAAHFLLPKDYLRWRLTGDLATDPSDASGTLLCAIATRSWAAEIVAALGIPDGLLPPIHESSAVVGVLQKGAARALGLRAGIPIVTGGGDAECAALGLGLSGAPAASGLALATLGTAGQFSVIVTQPITDPRGRLQTLCHVAPDRWHVMGAILAGASALDWLATTVVSAGSPSVPIATLLAEAATEPPGAHGLLFLPALNGTRLPDMDPLARGAFVGLRADHGRASLARAVVEGVALTLHEGLGAMRELHIPIERVRLAGGAQRHPIWARVQADVFGLPVEVGLAEDSSALGAALLAAVGVGALPSVDVAAQRITSAGATLQPDAAASALYARYAALARRLAPRLRATNHVLAASAE